MLSKLYDEGKTDDVKVYLSYSMKYFLFVAIPAVFGLSVLAKPLLEILTSSEFILGSSVICFIALAGLLSGVFQIIINITHLVKKTQFNLVILVVGATINFILNVVFVPLIGISGAAVATTLSYLVMAVLCIAVSFKYIIFNFHIDFIVKSVFASGIMAGLIFLFDPVEFSSLIMAVIGGVIIYVLFMVVIFRSFSQKEFTMLKYFLIK